MARTDPDLHDHIEALKKADLLIVVDRPINEEGKWIVAVDTDIDADNNNAIFWASSRPSAPCAASTGRRANGARRTVGATSP